VAPYGIHLQVIPSAGSQENVQAVFSRPNTQLGIVQSDVLTYISVHSNDAELKRIARSVRSVFPLYNEEVHVLARKSIATLTDLSGKRVVVGEKQSGTFLTATILLEQAGVRPGQEINRSAADGIQALRQGQADAVFYVAGQPTPLFIENVSETDDVHLVPVTDPRVIKIYDRSSIPGGPGGAYPWQPTEVPTVAVRAILMTYEYGKSNAYQRQSCEAVGQIARIIRDRVAELQQSSSGYHPKWQQVDLDRKVPNWDQGRCVQEVGADKPNARSRCLGECANEVNPVTRKLCENRCRSDSTGVGR
jgi:TRAP transporter TAXI family solute receptor